MFLVFDFGGTYPNKMNEDVRMKAIEKNCYKTFTEKLAMEQEEETYKVSTTSANEPCFDLITKSLQLFDFLLQVRLVLFLLRLFCLLHLLHIMKRKLLCVRLLAISLCS